MKTKIFIIGLAAALLMGVRATAYGAEVVINLTAAGTLKDHHSDVKSAVIFTLTGTIDARDVKYMRDSMSNLKELDLSAAAIEAYSGTEGTVTGDQTYPANEMPKASFYEEGIKMNEVLVSVQLPAGITAIGNNAFTYCLALRDISFPAGLTAIGDGVFDGCEGLKSVSFPARLTTIGDNAFYGCATIDSLSLPDGLTSIGSNVFQECRGLKDIIFPAGLTTIGANAFKNCNNVASITSLSVSPAATELTSFQNIKSSSTLTVPTSAVTAYSSAPRWSTFKQSTTGGGLLLNVKPNIWALGSVAEGSGLYPENTVVSRTAIPASDKYAFFSWTGGGGARLGVEPTLQLTLGQDTVVTANFGSLCQNTEAGKLGETLGELAGIERLAVEGVIDARDVKYMRDNMPNLKELDLSAAAIEAYSGTEGTVTSDRTYPANELPTASFSGKYVLISVKLPAGLTAIGDSAFKSSGLRYVYFPASGFATVGDEAFMGCTALEEATLLSGITAIGQRAFKGCTELKSISLPAGLTAIGANAFESSGLTEVTIPGTAAIGDEAFKSCTALEEATLLSGITTVGQRAFKGCTGLKSISLPDGLTAIGDNAFESSGLTEVTIPGTAAIGENAFMGCTALEKATLLSGITTVGQRAFKGCTELKSISLPAGLTAIGDNAFESSGLTEVVIPGTAAIGENAFKSCTELKEVTLLNGITVIGDSAFNGCNGIDTVINLSLIPQIIDTSVFYGVSLGATVLLIPDTCGVDLCKDIYAVADVWKGFHPHIFASATVTYNSRGGTSVDNKQIMLYRLATFFESSRDNYRFTGWYKDVSCIDKWDFENDQVVHNITLYAGWIRQYTVSFVSNNGNSVVDTIVDSLTTVAAPAVPHRTSYRFTGWYKEADCTDKWSFETDTVVQDTTLYAGWIRQYTVRFNSMAGSSVSDTIVDSSTMVTKPADPHRHGHFLKSWCKEMTCVNSWNFTVDKVTQDTMLFAKWEVKHYKVTFESNGGSSVKDTLIDSLTVVEKPADPHRVGYNFMGWYKDNGTFVNEWNFETDTVTKPIALYAKWEIKKYKVTFNSNGGSAVTDTSVDSLTVVKEPVSHLHGHKAVWYKDADCTEGNIWNFETNTVTKPIALYAKWEIKKYKVTFNSNGGSAVTDTSVDSLTVVNEPAVPHRVGYIFQGWYSMSAEDSITWSFETDTVTQDTTLYAKWKIKQYAVNFVSNGGSDVAPYLYVDSLTAIMAPFPVPHLHGHDLAGWYTDVTFNEEWDFAVDRVTQDTTLYAKWEIKKYNVTFNSNGDSAVTDTLVDSLTVVNRPAAPHRVGYNFQEWYKDADCTEEWNFTTDTVTQDTTLYALWEIKKYTVTFASNGGSAVAPLTEVDSLKKINEPAEPHFLGHDFKGWYKDDVTFTEKWEFTTDTVTQHTTLYALWEIKKYAVTFESNGGSNVEPWLNVDSLSKIAKPADPHFLGHDLVGWYKDDVTFTDDWSFNEDSVTQNITLYAKWKIKSYTVHFVSNGGSDVTDTLVDSLTVVTRPAVPHRVGYIFQNWYKDADCTDEWDFTTDKVTQDTTLYADWEIKHYTVTFESNGGSFTGSQMIDSLNKVNPVDNPHRVGYDFTGWYKDADCTEGNIWILETDSVTQSITLYAGWEIKHYTVTFNSNGGSDVGDTLVDSLTVVSRPADPTRAEYIFAGWYRDAAYASAWNFASDVVTANTTLYARWISVYATTYAVAFESNGGSAVDPQTVEEGGKVAQVTAPAYPGHNFKGWYGDEELTAAWDFATNTVTQDTTLYAKWIATYTVTFNVGEGSSVDPQPVEEGDKVTQPNAPTRIGYAFAGWYRDAAFTSVWSFTSDRVTQDTTLYAKWISGTATTYAVAFESYEGSAVDPQTVEANGKVAQVTAPVYPGHNFKGWYGDAECTEKWDFETNTVTQDTTLYAKWIATYTVTFSADEGSSVDPQTVEEGDKVAQPADPTRADYIFAGWYRDAAYASAWNFASDVVTANTTLYARWISVYATTYTVAFESNGGSAVDPQTVEEGGKVAQVTAPAYPGHNFKGWYGDEECTEKWDFETDTVTQDTTLYAKWAAIYTVTFNSNGGSAVDPQEVEVEEGDKVTQPNAPNRVGYAFAGWYRDAAYASAWNFASDVVTANTTLYAKWALVYTVTFTANGGSDISPQTVAHGSTAAQPAAPTRDGYAFMGWYKEATLTTLWNFANDVVTANITLYAKWVGAYTVTFNTNHGSIVNLQMVPVGGKVAQPDNPTRAGYTFVGWYSDETFASAWDFNATVAGDMTLYAKWNDPSSTGVEGHALSVARVYPNPTSGEVTIESEGAEARLYSSQGVLLKRTHSNRLDLSGYPAGVYLLRTGGKAAKVVKQ